jgi:hypothetical protein
MAITTELKVQIKSSDRPSAYTIPAQVFTPSSSAQVRRNEVRFLDQTGIVDATNLTGFTQLLTAIETDFTTNILPELGLDATQTIDILVVIKAIDFGKQAIIEETNGEDRGENQYTTSVDGFQVKYDIYIEETA